MEDEMEDEIKDELDWLDTLLDEVQDTLLPIAEPPPLSLSSPSPIIVTIPSLSPARGIGRPFSSIPSIRVQFPSTISRALLLPLPCSSSVPSLYHTLRTFLQSSSSSSSPSTACRPQATKIQRISQSVRHIRRCVGGKKTYGTIVYTPSSEWNPIEDIPYAAMR